MKQINYLTLTASPQLHPAVKPRSFASLSLQRRSIYGRERRCNAGKELDNETGLYYYGARYLDPKTSRWLSGDPAVGEYVPSAPVNEEAKKRNGSLPGTGGVFNYANLHVYHYAGNNPVRYVDPDGKWTFSLGLSGSANKGLGVQSSVGIAFGYSKDAGFSFGVYASGGAIIGTPSAGIGITGSFSAKTESVHDLNGESSTIGGGIGIGKGISLDININDNEYVDPALGVSLTVGIKGTPIVVEGHVSASKTATISTSVPEIIQGMKEIEQKFNNFILEKIMEQKLP